MKNITHIAELQLDVLGATARPREVSELFKAAGRRLVQVDLRGGEVLAKHHAAVPITVLCLAGKGKFRAGDGLDESQQLLPGTLITLEAGVEHDVIAEPDLSILVTKFGS